ncbi:MAG: HDOD domain-containing protein [Deltaproteobacteria bacterium]|nr:HDOD domain-containing protein [Deltaproteobacteria bacterium]
MDSFLARQPIFDPQSAVYAYELLFRSAADKNWFTGQDPDQASGKVIHSSVLDFDWESLTGGRRAFVNLTRQGLLAGWVKVLPPEKAVVEVLETVAPDPEVIAACAELKRAGYLLALDDFVYAPEYEPLLALADFVKIDFLLTKERSQREAIARALLPRRIRMLAEKVETREDLAQGRELGYTLFQGYFFCRPEMLATKEIPPSRLAYLRLLQELHRPEVGFDRLEQIVKQDLSLSVKLLRYLNSAAFRWSSRVSTIRQALALLGERPLRQWASVAAFASLGEGRPAELVVTSLVRALFCERLAACAGLAGAQLDLFLVGLLSALDALVGRPLPELLAGLSLRDEVRDTLLGGGRPTKLAPIWALAQTWERGDFVAAEALGQQVSVPTRTIAETYRQALAQADAVQSSAA